MERRVASAQLRFDTLLLAAGSFILGATDAWSHRTSPGQTPSPFIIAVFPENLELGLARESIKFAGY
jgi:hypothetical protein